MHDTLLAILDQARWAPSGDNTQPWRFALRSPTALTVYGHDTRHDCVYDLQGEASQVALGSLLQTMAFAASQHGWAMQFSRHHDADVSRPTFDVEFTDTQCAEHPLAGSIQRRSVQRRAMSTRPLAAAQMQALELAAGAGYRVRWLASLPERWAVARLLFASAKLRLTMPEAYAVHRRIIAWDSQHSEDRVPDAALGASTATLTLMRFGLQSWSRVQFFNRFLAGTVAPRIELDLIPGLACAAHFVLLADREPTGVDDFVAAGQAVQRVWLSATAQGLWQQPEMTPLIFARYARQGVAFSRTAGLDTLAQRLATRLQQVIGTDAAQAVWLGRLGSGPAPTARSVRLPLARLVTSGPDADQKYQVPTA